MQINDTIEQFFIRVNRGQNTFADLIDEFREYQRIYQMRAYQQNLPLDADALKHECMILKFGKAA